MPDDAVDTAAYAAAYDHVRLSPRARRAAVALVAAVALLLGLAAPALAAADGSGGPGRVGKGHGPDHAAKAQAAAAARNAAKPQRQRSSAAAGTGSISGHLTVPGADPFYSRYVAVTDGTFTRYGYADYTTGNYSVTGLPAGSYRVEFNRVSGYSYSEAQFYNGHPEYQGPGSADPITLTAGQDRSGIDATLVKGGSISGTLVDGSGAPLVSCRVEAYTDNGVLVARQNYSNYDGTFSVGGLTTGTYKVRVIANHYYGGSPGYNTCDGGTQYLTSSTGTTSIDPAAAVGVGVTRGVDTPLSGNVVYQIGGRISGHLTLPADARYSDRFVVARNLANGAITRSTLASKDDGSYTISGLPTGSYRVTFARLSGIALSQTEFFNDHPESAGIGSADAVSVSRGNTHASVDATLVQGGSISGHLADGAGADLAGCYVQAFTTDGSLVTRAAYTGTDGSFAVAGLSTGSYKLRVVQPKKRRGHHVHHPVPVSRCDRAVVYYRGAPELGDRPATAIPVTAGVDHPLGDLVYQVGGTITGHVDLPADYQRNDSIVVVRKYHTHQTRSARVGEDGTYSVSGLGPGSYRVTFARVSGFAVSAAEFYDDHPESAGVPSADLVTVTADGTETADATLTEGGHITGTLTDTNGTYLHCLVQAFTTDGSRVTRTAISQASANGTFDIGGLTSGQYYVRVVPMPYFGCHSATQFLTGTGGTLTKTGPGTAVTVTQGATSAVTQPLAYARTTRLHNDVAPSVMGSPRVGSVLTASPGAWSPSGVTFAFQWRANGVKIPGAAAGTYVPTSADVGKVITVLVTAFKTGYRRNSHISPGVGPVTAATVVSPPPPAAGPAAFSLAAKASFKGTAKVGQTLKAVAGATAPAATSVTYQWLLNGKAIKKATKGKYKLTKADAGRKISLQITYVRSGYTTLVSVSSAKKVKAAPKK